MRWWLNTDNNAFSVDNALVVGGMDFSSLPADLWMVHWTDGRGEIEYQDPGVVNPNGTVGANLNGLRDNFTDVIPYAPFFQQFLIHLPGLTLTQAKKVQIELIEEIFDEKRQLPFHYAVTAGDFHWDATDEEVTAMSNQFLPKVATMSLDISGLVNAINTMIDQVNSQVNARIVSPGASTNNIVNTNGTQANVMRDFINNPLIDTLNSKVSTHDIGTIIQPSGGLVCNVAAPGLSGNIAYTAATFYTAEGYAPSSIAVTHISFSFNPGGSVVVPWIPIEQSTPVDLSTAEMSGIMSGISSRRIDLTTKKKNKIAAVNALTTIPAVIAYDVTTGW